MQLLSSAAFSIKFLEISDTVKLSLTAIGSESIEF